MAKVVLKYSAPSFCDLRQERSLELTRGENQVQSDKVQIAFYYCYYYCCHYFCSMILLLFFLFIVFFFLLYLNILGKEEKGFLSERNYRFSYNTNHLYVRRMCTRSDTKPREKLNSRCGPGVMLGSYWSKRLDLLCSLDSRP